MTIHPLNEQQQKAATTLHGPVSIAAGAGSGKTRVLAERCANAVAPDEGEPVAALDELLAITFTDKAAGELAERVRRTLRARGEYSLGAAVDRAWISTIHGMCARILKASALEAGVDPSFVLLDATEAGRIREQALDEVVQESLRAGEAGDLLGGYPFDQVAEAVYELASAVSRAGMKAADLNQQACTPALELCREARLAFTDAIDRFETCGGPEEIVAGHVAECSVTARRVAALCESEAPESEVAAALWRALSSHVVPRTSKGVRDIKDGVSARLAELTEQAAATATRARCEALLDLTDRYMARLHELKQRRGYMDFDDLQHGVLRLFRERPDVAARWARTFKVTMVDEFQDTDAQQLGIIRAIAQDDLCTVGDAMQSIYRFRGAEVDVYRAHTDAMIGSGATSVELGINYRSHAGILEFVNEVFGRLDATGLVKLVAGRGEPDPPYLDQRHRVELLVSPLVDRKSGPSRTGLAARIASRIAQLNREQGVPLSDVVVLLRTYTHAEKYADALREEGLDAVVVGGNRFLGRPEVGVMRALCRVLANRTDEEALGVVLGSPLCGLSDDGLLQLRRAVEEGRAVGLADALVSEALSETDDIRRGVLQVALKDARLLVGRRPLGEVLLRVFERTGWDLRCLSHRTAGLQTYATVIKLARMADTFEQGGGSGPAAFSAYLDAKERYGDHESPAAVTGEGADAVRIMSIHASKGLEFPVVVVPELDGLPRAETGIARWSVGDNPRVAMQLPSSWGGKTRCGSWFEEINDASAQAERAEYLRVFYVAFTRARELLLLAGVNVTSESRSMLRHLLDTLDWGPGSEDTSRAESLGVHVETVEPIDVDLRSVSAGNDPTLEAMREWDALLATPAQSTSVDEPTPDRLSYSGLAAFDECPRRFHAQRVGRMIDRSDPEATGPSAVGFGSAVHAAFEIDADPDDMAALEVLARFHKLGPDDLDRLRSILRTFADSDVAATLEHWDGTIRREVPFVVPVESAQNEGFVLEGSIDLYARSGDSALIVDYKTGTSLHDDLRAAYLLQAQCYALAALADGAREVHVVFARPEVTDAQGRIERAEYFYDRSDGQSIAGELLARWNAMATGAYPPREQRDPHLCRRCPVAGDCPAPM